ADRAPEVPVRVYTAAPGPDAGARPAILWIHGGGYMFGTGLGEDARLARWADGLDAVVVSVEYRLAPEHPYPEPLDDCYAVTRGGVVNAAAVSGNASTASVGRES